MTKSTIITGWITFTIFSFLTILAVYCIITYEKLSRHEECCKKRRVWIICDVCLVITGMLWQGAYLGRPEVYDIPSLHITLVAILFGFISAAMALFADQIWLVYYQINLSKAINKEKWQKIINNELNTNWFINNSDTYGNEYAPIKIFIAFALIGMKCF